MRVTKAQDTALVVIVLVDINAQILVSWVFCLSKASCSKWTDINYPSAHPPSLNRVLCCRWCKWPGICKIQYMTEQLPRQNAAQVWDRVVELSRGLCPFTSCLTSDSSPLLQELGMQVFVSHCLNNLESPDRLPENRIPDGESGTWPETSLNLMQLSFSQSALEWFLEQKKYRNAYQGNITITISF